MNKYIDALLADATRQIVIVSGEGEIGGQDVYVGKRTLRAIKGRLARERCRGERWARAIVYSHSNDWGDVGVDLMSGEYCTMHVIDEGIAA